MDVRWDVDVDLDQGLLLCRRLKNGRDGVHKVADEERTFLAALRERNPGWTHIFESTRAPLTRYAVNKLLTMLGQQVGIKVTPHSLRHTCGYELAMRGPDTRRLQVYLGHASISSTVVYTDLAAHAMNSIWAV